MKAVYRNKPPRERSEALLDEKRASSCMVDFIVGQPVQHMTGDNPAELNRLLRDADAATGIPTRLLYRDPTYTEHLAESRARFRRQNAKNDVSEGSEAE